MTGQHERIHVIFVHGLFSAAKIWADFQRLINEDQELHFVTTSCFAYDSPLVRFRPDRRIGDIDELADQLGTFLETRQKDQAVVLVTHSQGGLITQRFVVRALQRHKGLSLTNIRQIVMYACPNRGSEFFLLVRRFARFMRFMRSPQEHQLKPYTKVLAETQNAIVDLVLNATHNTDTKCHVPIASYGGVADKIVPPHEAHGIFRVTGNLPGDHFSIIRPADPDADAYRVLKNALIAAASARPGPAAKGEIEDRRKPALVTPPYEKRTKRILGREKLIALLSKNHRGVHVFAGPGGSGKSRLALEIAHQEKSRRLVWWIQPSRINYGMREVAIQLGAPVAQVDLAFRDVTSATNLVWELLDQSTVPWLLVIDNADEPRLLSLPDGDVADGTGWLRRPRNDDGMVIVTTLDRNPETWGRACQLHRITPLKEEDGSYLLMDRAGSGAGTNEQARKLSAELGGLPLALGAAGDYLRAVINTKVFPGPDAIRDFDSFRVAVRRWFGTPADARDSDEDQTWVNAVRSVSALSLQLLTERGFSEAGPLLKLFACLAISPIPYHVLLSTEAINASPLFPEFHGARRRIVLEALDNIGLVETSHQPHNDGELAYVLTLHPVNHGLLRKDEDVQRQRNEYYGLNVRMMLDATATADPDEPKNWSLWNALAPHTIELCRSACLGTTPLDDHSVISSSLELARLTIRYLVAVAVLVPANQLVRDLIANCDRFGFAKTDRPLLGLRHELGRIEIERGNPAAAEKELAEVIALRTEFLGEDDPDTLASRHKHARAILDQNRWEPAEKLLRAIVAAEHNVRGPEHKDTLVVRHSLARAVMALGRLDEAETMLREIVAVYERESEALDSASSEASRVRSTLGRILNEQGRFVEAEEAMRNAVRQTSNSPDTTGAFWARWVLAESLLLQSRLPESFAEFEALEADQRRVLGANHPDTVRTSQSLDKFDCHEGG